MLFILGSIGTVFADENTTTAGSCEFTGKEMVSSFDSNKIAASVSQMEPGDSVTFSVDIKNNSSISTKWYMSNDVLKSLEDTQAVAENGGYSYILTFVGPDGKEDTIYSSTSVGGEKEATAGKGLNEATNSLDKFFYLKTLEPGEGGSVKLLVGLDGEYTRKAHDELCCGGQFKSDFAKSTYIYNYNEQGEDRRYLVNSVSCSVCDWYYFDDTGFRK